MKKIIMFVCFSMVVLLSNAQTPVNKNGSELNKKEQEVWNNVLALNAQVFGTKDSVIIDGLVGADVEYGHSGGNIEDKQAMVHNAAVSQTNYKDISHQLISVKIVGKVAIVRYVLKGRSILKEVDTPLELGIIKVWQKEGNKWQLIERQAVKLNAPK